jgi:hypothetical protein
MHGEIIYAHSFIVISSIESLYGNALGLKHDFYFRRNYSSKGFHWAEQLTCSIAEGRRIHVSVHG